MATWPEARAAKDERQRREKRFYTPDQRGPRPCPECGGPTDAVVAAADGPTHPTCHPVDAALLARG